MCTPPSKRGGRTVKVAFARFSMSMDDAPAVPADSDSVNGDVRRQHSKIELLLRPVTMAVASRNVFACGGRPVGTGGGAAVLERVKVGWEIGGRMEVGSEIGGSESCARAGAANKRTTALSAERIPREESRCFTRAVQQTKQALRGAPSVYTD